MTRVINYIHHWVVVFCLLSIPACDRVNVPPSELKPDTIYFCLKQKLFLCPTCIKAVEEQCVIVERLAHQWPVMGVILNNGEEEDKKIRIMELQLNGFARANSLPFTFTYDRKKYFGNRQRIIVSHTDCLKKWNLPLSAQKQRSIIKFMSE